MKENEILEGNKLIAEFMEWRMLNGSCMTPYEDAGMLNGGETSICRFEFLKFHSSWDWLMPVVEKIQIKFDEVIIRYKTCVIYMGSKRAIEKVEDSTIKATWLAVVEFIKWYNNESKN